MVRTALLYAALILSANAALAADPAALDALRVGELRKLAVHAEPQEGSAVAFTSADGAELTLADFAGQTVLLNFWATWCAPCRKEMPALDAVQERLGSDTFTVLAVATGKNDLDRIDAFFTDEGIQNLGVYLDPKSALARDMGVFGLPITVILNPAGQEIARMRGEADWASDAAIMLLQTVIGANDS